MFRFLVHDFLDFTHLIGNNYAVAPIGVFARLDDPDFVIVLALLDEVVVVIEGQRNEIERVQLVVRVVVLKVEEKRFFIGELIMVLQVVMNCALDLHSRLVVLKIG